MVLKLPSEANLDSYRALCSDDAEQDFFNNIVHLQVKPLFSSSLEKSLYSNSTASNSHL